LRASPGSSSASRASIVPRKPKATRSASPGSPGATDGTFLNKWANIPIVTTGAGDREIPHHRDEWVSVDELFTTCKLYAATAMYFGYGKDAHV
jgi:acetylornithine deacetylase/succinyl-diaminopimelate desuccinylase-like protein